MSENPTDKAAEAATKLAQRMIDEGHSPEHVGDAFAAVSLAIKIKLHGRLETSRSLYLTAMGISPLDATSDSLN